MTIVYAPYLSTPAGACLTHMNWRELGIQVALCGLAEMVIKPGLAFWQQGMNLKTYLGWDGILILDARTLNLNGQGDFLIQSPYDGSKVMLSLEQYWDLVRCLKPDKILNPKAAETESLEQEPAGQRLFELALGFQLQDSQWLCYEEQVIYASDRPAQDAQQGWVYHLERPFFLHDPGFAMAFQLLEADCLCPTCKQGLTRAYLHYLLQSTPLLAQRFLIMHNLFQMIQYLKNVDK